MRIVWIYCIGLATLSGGLGCSLSSTSWSAPHRYSLEALPTVQNERGQTNGIRPSPSSYIRPSPPSSSSPSSSDSSVSTGSDTGPAPGGISWDEWKDLQHTKCIEDNELRKVNFQKLQNARSDIRAQCRKIGRDMTMSPDPDSVSAHDHLERDDNGHIIYVDANKQYIRINAEYRCPADLDEFHKEVASRWMYKSPPWIGLTDCEAFYRP